MEWLALATGTIGAVLWGFKLLYNWRERQAGRNAERLAQHEKRERTVGRAGEIDSEVRRLDDAGLGNELRDKWTRD